MRKFSIFSILLLFYLCFVTGCQNYSGMDERATNIKESSIESPLKLKEWGKANMTLASINGDSYPAIPIRIIKVSRGNAANKIIKKWANENNYKYEDPKKGYEWIVFEYQIDLTDFEFAENDYVMMDVDAFIRDLEGSIKGFTRNLNNHEEKNEPGIYNGKFVSHLEIGDKDYIVSFGNDVYKEEYYECAYVKPE